MKSESVHIVVEAPHQQVFAYVSDIRHLPQWATPFCQRLESRDGAYYVTSPAGQLAFEMQSSRETGAVDLRFGRAHDRLMTFPIRVVPLPDDKSLVVFTGWQLPGLRDDEFVGQIEGMQKELGQLKSAVEQRR